MRQPIERGRFADGLKKRSGMKGWMMGCWSSEAGSNDWTAFDARAKIVRNTLVERASHFGN